MTAERLLIVNADDFGQSDAINEGVALAFERGIVRSASLMARWPDAVEAAAYARRHPGLSVGLHFDLGEWSCRDGAWFPEYSVLTEETPDAVREEVDRQLCRFEELLGRPPSHIDAHQHVHREEPARSLLLLLARRLGVPLRDFEPGLTYRGDFYGQTSDGRPLPQAIGVASLLQFLQGLPPGASELGCHPATRPVEGSMYSRERVTELATLLDPRVDAALEAEGIELISFDTLQRRRREVL